MVSAFSEIELKLEFDVLSQKLTEFYSSYLAVFQLHDQGLPVTA